MPLRIVMVIALALLLTTGCSRKVTGPESVKQELKDLQDARKREWTPDP